MQLVFQTPYLSIREFQTVELPRLTVLTGVNGAGKTHLLQAISQGHIVADDIQQDDIVMFSGETFRLDNQNALTASQAIQERYNAWSFLTQQGNPNIFGNLSAFRNNLGQQGPEIVEISKRTATPLWRLTKQDGLTDEQVSTLHDYKRNVQSFLLGSQFRGNHQAESILTLCKKITGFVDQLPKDRFEALYEPRQFRERFLPNQLTLAFADYYSKLEENQYWKFRNDQYGETHQVLSPEQFTKQYGPKPWDVINEVLSRLGTMPYKVNSPEGLTRFDAFQAQLIHTYDSGIRPNFSDLSSGEKVLIALVTSVYKASSDRNFPRLLLLDEIDASLHPSMMRSMLQIIEDAFISNGVNTLLITHSPTTVAICPEEAIHVMYPEGAKRVEHRTRADALEILTEGFVTLTQGLSVLDQVAQTKVSVVTEGKNADYLRRAFEIADVKNVEVVSGVQDRSGSSQLKTLYDFFSKLPHKTIVVIAWDCDADKYRGLSTQNNTVPFVFSRNENNSLAPRGIENLFSEQLLDGFKKQIYFADGAVKSEFDENQKGRFAEFILQRNEDSDFILFAPFVELVRRLATSAETPIPA